MRDLGLFVLATVLSTACGEPEPTAGDQLADSREVWASMQAEDYTYVRYDVTTWLGVSWEATVTVVGGVVTAVDYMRDDEGTVESWTEVGADVGSHGLVFPRMEALYDECADDVLPQIGGTNLLTFDTFDDGLMKDCYYIDDSNGDGTSFGVELRSVVVD